MYQSPKLEIMKFFESDVIRTSNDGLDADNTVTQTDGVWQTNG